LQRNSGVARRRAGWAICAWAIVQGAPVGADTSFGVERACKPVVPQVIVNLVNPTELRAGYQLLVRYDEAGSAPFSNETFGRINVRSSGCDVKDGRCIGSRARYERRFEGPRNQSIQLRKMGGWVTESESNLLGGVQWNGPSYPDQVKITCDLANSNPQTACKLDNIEYTPNPSTSGRDGLEPSMGRHDKCKPIKSTPVMVKNSSRPEGGLGQKPTQSGH
jgi:hypothetical protein